MINPSRVSYNQSGDTYKNSDNYFKSKEISHGVNTGNLSNIDYIIALQALPYINQYFEVLDAEDAYEQNLTQESAS